MVAGPADLALGDAATACGRRHRHRCRRPWSGSRSTGDTDRAAMLFGAGLVPLGSAVAAALTPVGPALYGAVLGVGAGRSSSPSGRPRLPAVLLALQCSPLMLAVTIVLIRARRVDHVVDSLFLLTAGGCALWSWRTVPVAAAMLMPLAAAARAGPAADGPPALRCAGELGRASARRCARARGARRWRYPTPPTSRAAAVLGRPGLVGAAGRHQGGQRLGLRRLPDVALPPARPARPRVRRHVHHAELQRNTGHLRFQAGWDRGDCGHRRYGAAAHRPGLRARAAAAH